MGGSRRRNKIEINYKLFNEKGKKEPLFEINIKTPTKSI